jgi:hypothetical protein
MRGSGRSYNGALYLGNYTCRSQRFRGHQEFGGWKERVRELLLSTQDHSGRCREYPGGYVIRHIYEGMRREEYNETGLWPSYWGI